MNIGFLTLFTLIHKYRYDKCRRQDEECEQGMCEHLTKIEKRRNDDEVQNEKDRDPIPHSRQEKYSQFFERFAFNVNAITDYDQYEGNDEIPEKIECADNGRGEPEIVKKRFKPQ